MANENRFLQGIDGFIFSTLMRGCDDWVQACEIVDNIFNLDPFFQKDVEPKILEAVVDAVKAGGSREFEIARDLSLSIIGKVLVNGLMLIGEIDKNGFTPWHSSIEESLREVRAEWDKMAGKLPGLGVYWLCNTQRGKDIGQSMLLGLRQDRKSREGPSKN